VAVAAAVAAAGAGTNRNDGRARHGKVVRGFKITDVLEVPFQVDLISEVPAPDGSNDVWQQYVISQGTNVITGLRPGARAEVAAQLDEMVARLNERRVGKKPK
jgi:hypothetical protein